MMESFTPVVTDEELRDLRARLRATRWPEPETDPSQGVALADLQELCRYWAEAYDWRACEERLGAVGQYRTTIDGLGIYFLHARSPQADALPLVLTHGWPGSVVEFLDVIDVLTRAGFHCVVPSLPGYGWSDKPTGPAGTSTESLGRGPPSWRGSATTATGRRAATGAPASARASASRTPSTSWGSTLCHRSPRHDRGLLRPPATAGDDESGYSEQQRTRPQTIGYSLIDSPAGLAAWITEKVRRWSDPRSPLSRNSELDNLMFYWLPRTGASAARLYWESLGDVARWLRDRSMTATSCTSPQAAASSPTSSSGPRAVTRSSGSRTSATGTSPSAVATSPPGSNRSCSLPRLKPFSGSFGEELGHNLAGPPQADPSSTRLLCGRRHTTGTRNDPGALTCCCRVRRWWLPPGLQARLGLVAYGEGQQAYSVLSDLGDPVLNSTPPPVVGLFGGRHVASPCSARR